ncbi:MAG: hypothetical protein AAFW73_16085, partial [Bacteroidota bacterium]
MKRLVLLALACLLLIPASRAQDCNPIPGSIYFDAPIINCSLDGYTFQTSPFSNPYTGPSFCADPHNSQWLAFYAKFDAIQLRLSVSNCVNPPGTQGLQAVVYGLEGDLGSPACRLNPNNLFCERGVGYQEDIFITLDNLEWGRMYYLVIDGYLGDICEYSLEIVYANYIPDPNPPTISGPGTVGTGSTHTFTFNPNGDLYNPCGNFGDDGCCSCVCNLDPSSWVVQWTVPPGATVTTTGDPFSAEITFGDLGGEVCAVAVSNCLVLDACWTVTIDDPICNDSGIELGADCENAPLLCAEFLDGYCGSTLDGPQALPGDLSNQLSCPMEQPGWLRFSPCEDSISLHFNIGNCQLNQGIQMAILQTDDCQDYELVRDCIVLADSTQYDLLVGGLEPGAIYHLLVSGQGDDQCQFQVDILAGIHPGDPGTLPDTAEFVIREIRPAQIDGPDFVCQGEVATYTYVPPICEIAPGDCDTLLGFGQPAPLNPYCPLPDGACLPPELIIVDTFLVWHLPDGSTVIGDSTDYSIDVTFDPPSSCIDSVYSDSLIAVDTSCMGLPMIPDTGSGVFYDTIIQQISVEIGYTFLIPPDSTSVDWIPSQYGGVIPDSFFWYDPAGQNVYCPCPAATAICGDCTYGASRDVGVRREYRWNSEVICEPECSDFCGTTLCSASQYWCKGDCGYDILNLGIDRPEIFNLGVFEVCEWDCYFLEANQSYYCGEGDYDIPVIDPVSGCEDRYRFTIYYIWIEEIVVSNITHECSPDNQSYTVSFDIFPPWNVWINGEWTNGSYTSDPIPNGEDYSFLLENFDICPYFEQVSGSFDCMPCDNDRIDLGTVSVCEGDCYNYGGQDYCAAGEYLIPEPDGTGCVDTTRFLLEVIPYDVLFVFIDAYQCAPDNASYTVDLFIDGPPPFVVNGDFVGGNLYTSAPIPDGSAFTFNISSLTQCPSAITISGSHDCTPCTADLNDLGTIGLCPGDCYNYQGQDYCNAGSYDLTETDPNGCVDTTRFTLEAWSTDPLTFANLTTDCAPDNGSYTVSFDLVGNPPFIVDGQVVSTNAYTSTPFPDEASYLFIVESTGPCPTTLPISGSHDCTPCTADLNDLGTIGLCPGDCYNYQGQDYCNAGSYDLTETDPNGCVDTTRFTLEEWNTDPLGIANLSTDCASDSSSYTVSFELLGTPPFLIDGQSFGSNLYVSAPIPDETSFSFFIETTGACPTSTSIAGSLDCTPCTADYTDLGTIPLCEGDCYNFRGQDYCSAGEYLVTESDAEGCVDTTRFELTLIANTQASISALTELCDVTQTMYTVSFTIYGRPPFSVNGQPLPNGDNFFQSVPLFSGSAYYFEVMDAEACAEPRVVQGTFSCQGACAITAGTLDELTDYDCASQTVKAVHDGNAVLGGDDLMEYVLYQGNDLFSGTILVRNTDGVFPFNSSFMAFEEPYEMVAIAGNLVNGEVDLNDICLSISNQVEVVYYEAPTLLRSQAQDSLVLTCADPSIRLEALYSGGSGRYEVQWSGNGLTWDSTGVDVQLPGIYRFQLADAVTGCSLRDSATVLQNQLAPTIEWALIEVLDCATESITLDATGSSQHEAIGFGWSTADGNFVGAPQTLETRVNKAGTYTLRMEDSRNGCVREESVEVIDLQDDIRSVVLDVESTLCEGQEDAWLEVMAVEGGNPNYEYKFNGHDYGTAGRFESLTSGTYPLHVVDAKGCTYDTLVQIQRAAAPDIQLPSSIELTLGEHLHLEAAANFPIHGVQWLDADGNLLSDSTTWDLLPDQTRNYEVILIDPYGCEVRQSIAVRVSRSDDLVFVPSAFSPNGDQVNDELLVFSHSSVRKIQSFHIFSRWGDLVHRCDGVLPDAMGGSCGW